MFHSVLPPDAVLDTAEAMAPFAWEQRGAFQNTPTWVLQPENTAQVQAIVRLAVAEGIGLVPQGGNSGLVGGTVAIKGQALVNFNRMNRIRALRPEAAAMTAEAGCILLDIKNKAGEVGLSFPLGLSVASWCRLGGNIASNAGGINVLRYGMTRQSVLGLEVVLADGSVYSDLEPNRKKNEGVDLKHLFIGSEGSLGFITAATLALVPLPAQRADILLTSDDPVALVAAVATAKVLSGESLSAFEVITAPCLDLLRQLRPAACAGMTLPKTAFTALLTLETSALEDIKPVAKTLAGRVHGRALNRDEAEAFWHLRRELPTVQKEAGDSVKHDIAVPLDRLPELFAQAEPLVRAIEPAARCIAFGHFGDGNIHYNLQVPDAKKVRPAINAAIFALVRRLGGAISAEHGIGLVRQPDYAAYTDPVTKALQRQLKQLFDPKNIFNPGKGTGAV